MVALVKVDCQTRTIQSQATKVKLITCMEFWSGTLKDILATEIPLAKLSTTGMKVISTAPKNHQAVFLTTNCV